jgi:hypothetical protein
MPSASSRKSNAIEVERVLLEERRVVAGLAFVVEPPFHVTGRGPDPIRRRTILGKVLAHQAGRSGEHVGDGCLGHPQRVLDLRDDLARPRRNADPALNDVPHHLQNVPAPLAFQQVEIDGADKPDHEQIGRRPLPGRVREALRHHAPPVEQGQHREDLLVIDHEQQEKAAGKQHEDEKAKPVLRLIGHVSRQEGLVGNIDGGPVERVHGPPRRDGDTAERDHPANNRSYGYVSQADLRLGMSGSGADQQNANCPYGGSGHVDLPPKRTPRSNNLQ